MIIETFQIDNTSFSAPLNPTNTEHQFQIISIPRPYKTTILSDHSPIKSIQQILEKNPNYLLFIDESVLNIYGSNLQHPKEKIFQAKATENFKTTDGMFQLIDFMNAHQITKGERLIVVGGGIIQDIGAFACAIFKRGIPWTFYPTTLLAQCDSCIGGKTGLNYKNTKNQIALFSAPADIIINPYFLKTLAPHEIKSGLGEVFKLHITGGLLFVKQYQTLYQSAIAGSTDALEQLILGSLSVKQAVVEKDEFELGLRRSMNYGHTLGHAIETISEFKISHGLAVVIGILLVNELSHRRNYLKADEKQLLLELGMKLLSDEIRQIMHTLPLEKVIDLLKKDKKTIGSNINFIILNKIGDMRILPLPINNDLTQEITHIIREIFH